MKIIYMGTPDFAVAPLAALAENGYEVEAVITQPDKPKGRGKTMMPTPVKEEALKHGIPVLQPVKVRDPEFVEELKNLADFEEEATQDIDRTAGCFGRNGRFGWYVRPGWQWR